MVRGLKSCGCTKAWQGWNILTLFNPFPSVLPTTCMISLDRHRPPVWVEVPTHGATVLCFLSASVASSHQPLSKPGAMCLCRGRNSRYGQTAYENLTACLCSSRSLFVWPWKVSFYFTDYQFYL